VGQQDLFFAPGSVLDGVVGVHGAHMFLDEIENLEVRRGRVVLHTHEGKTAFRAQDPHHIVEGILLRMASEPWKLDEAQTRALLLQGGWELAEDENLAIAARCTLGSDEAYRAQLILTDRRLLVMNGSGEGRDLPRARIQISRDQPDGSTTKGSIVVKAGGIQLTLGAGCDPELKKLIGVALSGNVVQEAPDLGHMKPLLGPVNYIRLIHDHTEVASFVPGFVMEQEEGVAVLLTDLLDQRCASGQVVRLEVGKKAGVYKVRCRVLRCEPITDSAPAAAKAWIRRQDEPPEYKLVLQPAEEVTFIHNRRDAFRVEYDTLIRARRMERPDGVKWVTSSDSLPCELVNLSNSGCGIRLMVRVQDDDRLELELPLCGETVNMTAEVVHVLNPVPEQPLVHGMRFVGLTEATRLKLQQEVVRREAEIAQEQALAEAALKAEEEG
jgi:hypothetical protein